MQVLCRNTATLSACTPKAIFLNQADFGAQLGSSYGASITAGSSTDNYSVIHTTVYNIANRAISL
jgi:hypothetical protein